MLSKIGLGELIVIFIVALFVVGPERLPKLGRSVGKAISGFKKYLNEVTDDIREESREFKDISSELGKIKKDVSDTLRGVGEDVAAPKKPAANMAKGEPESKETHEGLQ